MTRATQDLVTNLGHNRGQIHYLAHKSEQDVSPIDGNVIGLTTH